MIDQLLISKRLYQEGCHQQDLGNPVSDGIAVSLFQDSIEIYVWTLIKKHAISVSKNSDFTNNLGLIFKAGLRIPSQPKLLELNKARVGFKHYGNLPAKRDVEKFRNYTQEFLIEACLEHFKISFSDLSNTSLIASSEIQNYFNEASSLASKDELMSAYTSLGAAKYLIFNQLSSRLPHVNVTNKEYAADFKKLRELVLVAVHRIDLTEFRFARSKLPAAFCMNSGEIQCRHYHNQFSLEDFNRIYDFLLDLCIKESL